MLRDVLQHQALSISCCFYPHALLTKPGWGSPWMFWFTHNLCRGSQVIMMLPKLRNNVRPATDLISYLCWNRTWVWWLDLLILKVFSNFKNLKKPKPLVAVGLDHHQAPLALLTMDSGDGKGPSSPCLFWGLFSPLLYFSPLLPPVLFSSKWSCQHQLLLCWLSPGGSFEEGEQAQQFFLWDSLFLSTGSCKISDNKLVHS